MTARRAAAVGAQTKRSKYGNTKVWLDDHVFDSRAEGLRYVTLRENQRLGLIRDLKCHPSYLFEHGGVLIGKYTPDFEYVVVATGELVIEDVKSKPTLTTDYKLRKKLLRAFYGLTVTEVMR